MNVKILEHKILLIFLEKIQNAISEIEDPFEKNIVKYKEYISLLSQAIILLNETIQVKNSEVFNDKKYLDLNSQFQVIKKGFTN